LELLKTEIDQILPVFLWHPVLLFKKGIWFRYRTLGIAACKRSGGIAIVNVREEADLNKKGGIMFSRLFGKPKEEPNTLSTLDKLNETLEMLEKKEKVLQRKIATEIEKARDFTKAKNKRGMYE
jgi:hypothetical protein